MKGARVVHETVVEKVEHENLAVFVVWIPMFPGDSENKAVGSMRIIPDKRAKHYWDADRKVGKTFSDSLEQPDSVPVAWDIYFVFDEKAEWKDVEPTPVFWMHQLPGRKVDADFLDGDKLRSKIDEALR